MAEQTPPLHLSLCQHVSANCHIELAYPCLYRRTYSENAQVKDIAFHSSTLICSVTVNIGLLPTFSLKLKLGKNLSNPERTC